MHELSITQSVVESIAERVGDQRVTRVHLEIGRLSGVVVESIRFCFDLVAAGTVLEGATLDVDEPRGQAGCRVCGASFETTDPLVLCPSCGSAEVDVTAGRDLRILTVTLEKRLSEAPPGRR